MPVSKIKLTLQKFDFSKKDVKFGVLCVVLTLPSKNPDRKKKTEKNTVLLRKRRIWVKKFINYTFMHC